MTGVRTNVAPRQAVSVTIITRNEQDKLPACLASVSWADEVVVLDSGSTDDTERVARVYGARFERQDWLGFGAQKNKAAELATHDLILNVDADERVGEDLRAAIEALPHNHACFAVMRVSDFMGIAHRPVHRMSPEFLVRLYDRRRAAFAEVAVHEKVETFDNADPIILPGTLFHEGYRDFADFMQRLNTYSTLRAMEPDRRTSFLRLLVRPFAKFLWAFVRRGNVLDGRRGFILSATWAVHDFMVEAKCFEISQSNSANAFDNFRFAGSTANTNFQQNDRPGSAGPRTTTNRT